MKITIVQGAFLPVPPVMGGAVEKIWHGLGRAFARRGHDVVHVSRTHPSLPGREYVDGVRHVRVRGFDAPSSLAMLKLYDLWYTLRVRRMLPEADVLVSNTFWLPLLTRSDRYGRLYVHVARYPKGQMMLYGHAARLQAVSSPVAEAIRAQVPERIGRKVASIPNPLPPEVPVSSRAPTYRERRREILYVGRVHPEKGIEVLLEAFAGFVRAGRRDWRLTLVGPWRTELGGGGAAYRDRLARSCGDCPGTISFEGPVFEGDVLYAYHRRARLFVYPSLAERGESFGLAPLEAMACGCPPIVSDLSCFGDYLVDGKNGFVFDHRGEQPARALSRSMECALSTSNAWRDVAREGRRTAERFDVARIAEAYLEDFRSVLADTTHSREAQA